MQHLAHLKTANHTVSRPFQLCYGDLMGPFTPVAIGGYKYVSKIIDEYTKWTVVDQQEQSSSVALTSRRLDGHSLRRPDRTFSRRQGRQVHRGGVSTALLSPNTSRRGSRPFAPSRYWRQNLLRAYKGLQKGRHRGLGREGVRLHY